MKPFLLEKTLMHVDASTLWMNNKLVDEENGSERLYRLERSSDLPRDVQTVNIRILVIKVIQMSGNVHCLGSALICRVGYY
mmetsp:Transcript_25430/g.63529  ORF Transcript_25430/g.63529 Transcript_25430/m.63529 type:complete len:81 (+) Transcript_25430:61-303(+)